MYVGASKVANTWVYQDGGVDSSMHREGTQNEGQGLGCQSLGRRGEMSWGMVVVVRSSQRMEVVGAHLEGNSVAWDSSEMGEARCLLLVEDP